MTNFAERTLLEDQIAQWREYLRRHRAIHAPDVEELEGHLRDQVTELTEAGLAQDESFLIAVKRMGSLDALSREFAREHSERLWKQLVMVSDALGEPKPAARADLLVVSGLAVAAALAIKVPALGENLILLVNLAGSAWLYARFLRGHRRFAALESWQTAYLPIYSVWAALVVVVFPPLFGYV